MTPMTATPGDPRTVVRSRAALSGVRMRSALAAVCVVAVALAVGAGVLLLLLQRSLLGSVETSATTRAGEVARQIRTDGVTGLSSELQSAGSARDVVQVLRADGTIVAASAPQAARAPLTPLRPKPGEVQITSAALVRMLDPDEPYVVVARGMTHEGIRYVVAVAASVGAQEETVSTVAAYVAAGFPLLLLVVGGATFLFVGRSLLPVERIRRRVAGIGAQQLSDRVPVPGSRDEIARLAMTMNAMLDRLQVAHDSQRRFVADASHELRSPLATLRASLEVAAADPSDASWRDLHSTMDAEVTRMAHLVEDLLVLAKADEEGLRMIVTDVDLDDLVEAEVQRLRAATALHVAAELNPVRVSGDPVKLAQAIRNLTDNAARHASGRVEMHLRAEELSAVIEVDDDGPGIPDSDRSRVFERFVRLDSSRERASGGSGLGLAIVQEIVAGHRGAVTAGESVLGGARFTVRLPLAGQ
jgi:signal transduction histidine kinase